MARLPVLRRLAPEDEGERHADEDHDRQKEARQIERGNDEGPVAQRIVDPA
jgi:hypothetical protein